MKDMRIEHLRRGRELAESGFRLAAEGIGLEEMLLRSRRRDFKAGTIWLWATAEAWEPIADTPVSQLEGE